MNVISPHTIVNLYSQDKMSCSIPKSQMKIELTPRKIDHDQWSIILQIFYKVGNCFHQHAQTIECSDFNRHFIGYYSSIEEKKRYHVIDLSPVLTKQNYGFPTDEGLIWFQQGKEAIEVCSQVEGTVNPGGNYTLSQK